MPTMLRQKGSGDMYVYTDAMAQREDMEVVDIPDIAPKKEEPAKPAKQAKPKVEKPAKVETAEVESTAAFDSVFGGE